MDPRVLYHLEREALDRYVEASAPKVTLAVPLLIAAVSVLPTLVIMVSLGKAFTSLSVLRWILFTAVLTALNVSTVRFLCSRLVDRRRMRFIHALGIRITLDSILAARLVNDDPTFERWRRVVIYDLLALVPPVLEDLRRCFNARLEGFQHVLEEPSTSTQSTTAN